MITDITAELPANGPWPQQRTRTTAIVVHHSATPPTTTPQVIADYHVRTKGMPHTQYHALIYADGTIFQVNAWNDLVWHAGCGYDHPQNANSFSIGVCLVGDFSVHPPPDAQLAAFRELRSHLETLYGHALDVLGHSECYGVSTSCPGRTWPSWKEAPPSARWYAEEATRKVEDAIAVLQDARQRLVDVVIPALYRWENTDG